MERLLKLAGGLIWLSMIALCGCGGVTASSGSSNNGGSSGSLGSSLSSISFGQVTVGSTATQNVTVTNSSTAPIDVNQVTVTGAGFNMLPITTPFTLNPSQSVTATLSFSPTTAGAAAGSVSVASNPPLTIPMTGTGVTALAHSVDLSWNASTSTVSGYRVYRGTLSGGPYTLLTSSLVPSTSFTDSAVGSGSSYFYVVTAVDASDNESTFSNQASANIPTP